MKRSTISILAITAFVTVACGKFSLYNPDKGEKIASVGDQELYEQDIANIYTPGMTPGDSAAQRELFITQWVKTQIKNQAAEKSLSQFENQLEKMVNDYRTALLTHQFEEDYVSQHIDTNITDKQIELYYTENQDNFLLAGPLVKARVARIPAGLRQSTKLEKMFKSNEQQDLDDFINICNKNNYRVVDFATQWTDFSEVLHNIPFSQTNFDQFLRSKEFYEVEDDQYKYMMVITGKMLSGEKSPLEREYANIKKVLMHNRRRDVVKQLEDSIYNAAVSQGLVKINAPIMLVPQIKTNNPN